MSERVRVAVRGDRLAVDVFHREIRQAVCADARVVQSCDVRMLEPRQNVALACKPLREIAAQPIHQRQLQRDLARQRAIGTLGQPHVCHPACAQLTLQPIGADPRTGRKCSDTQLIR